MIAVVPVRGVCTTLAALVFGCALGCGAAARRAPEGSPDPAPKVWHYQLRLDPVFAQLEARVCFEGPLPRELRAGKDEAAGRLSYARWLGPGVPRALAVERGRIQLDPRARDGCLAYAVDLAESSSPDAPVRRVGGDLVASPNAWLWRPERRASDARATLSLALPEGVAALLPWPERDRQYLLDAEAFRFDSYAAFGRFTPIRGTEGGVQIEAALLDGALAIDREAALRWLRSAVELATQSDGHFPRTRLSAIVVPVGEHQDPVPFGMVARGGEASLLLLVSARASEAELRRDWVLPHELSHLLLPFVEREHAWLSEGFATYYQELLRARAGIASEREALARIAESLRSAARQARGPSVVAESGRMHLTQAYRKVYWGGAAYWLGADVELRQRSRGRVSLDTLLSRLRREGALRKVWRADALIERLDLLAGLPVFSRALASASALPFPPFEPTLAALGVRSSPGGLELDERAPLARLRRALFAPRR